MRLLAVSWLALLLASGCAAAAATPASDCLEVSASAGDPGAVEQLQSARRRILDHPDQAEAYGRLGMTLHAYERLDGALACYSQALTLEPDSVAWLYLRARIRAGRGDGDAALADLERVLERNPPSAAPQLLRAELLLLSGDLAGSEAAALRALELDPRSAPAHYIVGRVRAAEKASEQAAVAFRRALEAAPHFAQARYALAMAYRRMGRLDDAERELAIHQRLGQTPPPAAPDPWMEEVESLNRGARAEVAAGAILARSGRSDEAIERFEQALESNPQLPVAHANLILLYGQQGDLEQAERHYREAIALSPNWADAHANWGGLLLRSGRPEEAAAALERAVAASPHFASARLQLGMALDTLSRPEEAAEQFRLALRSDPLLPDAHYLLGRSLLSAGRLEEGLDALEKAVDVGDGRTAAYLEALARFHEADGRFELALGYARRALRRAREDGVEELVQPLEEAIERLRAKRAPAP